MREVIISICVDCKNEGTIKVIGCHDSFRKVKKIYCREGKCNKQCPKPTSVPSHGLCQKHFDIAFAKIDRRKQSKPFEKERRTNGRV